MGTLLIIDDSDRIRKDLIRILSAEGDFDAFLEAPDGSGGLRILSDPSKAVDVVCCDLNMPRMDGYQFLRLARANPQLMSIPIIMVTSETGENDVVKAFSLGANDFISKPFVPSILRARFKNMLHIKHLQDLLKAQRSMMEEMATKDPLTNLANQRVFRLALEDEFHRSRRYGVPMSILMVDLDNFKSINDTYGHPRGDAVLKDMARTMEGTMRKVDTIARYGGEEFVVIMPHTGSRGAVKAARRLLSAVEKHHFEGLPGAGAVTVSVGVATLGENFEGDGESLIRLADQALYRAKIGGRNRVENAAAPVE